MDGACLLIPVLLPSIPPSIAALDDRHPPKLSPLPFVSNCTPRPHASLAFSSSQPQDHKDGGVGGDVVVTEGAKHRVAIPGMDVLTSPWRIGTVNRAKEGEKERAASVY